MNKSMWNNEAVKAYESGQGVVLVEKPYPHYVPLNDTSIKEALAQPEQDGGCKHCTDGCPACDARKLPEQDWIERERAVGYREGHRAALAQCTWVGLKDKEIEEIWKIAMFTDYGIGAELSNQPFVHYARAIEAKLKDKNSNL